MRKSKLTRKQKEHIAAYLFILPSFLGIAVFYIVPYIICFTKSLYVGDTFVGIENYIQLFQNNTFLLALKKHGHIYSYGDTVVNGDFVFDSVVS